jgi:hypothetical protein
MIRDFLYRLRALWPGLWETDIGRCRRETVSASSSCKDRKDRKRRVS